MPQPSEHEPVFASADLPAEAARAWLTALFDAQAAAGDPEALTSGQRADLRELLGSTWWRSLFRGETAVEDPEAILIRALPPAVRAASAASEGAIVLALYLRNLINEAWSMAWDHQLLVATVEVACGEAARLRAEGADRADDEVAELAWRLLGFMRSEFRVESALLTGRLEVVLEVSDDAVRQVGPLVDAIRECAPGAAPDALLREASNELTYYRTIRACARVGQRLLTGDRRDAAAELDRMRAHVEATDFNHVDASELRGHLAAVDTINAARDREWLHVDAGRIRFVYPFGIRQWGHADASDLVEALRVRAEELGARGGSLGDLPVVEALARLDLSDVWQGTDNFGRGYRGATIRLGDLLLTRGGDDAPLMTIRSRIQLSQLGNHSVVFELDLDDAPAHRVAEALHLASPVFGDLRELGDVLRMAVPHGMPLAGIPAVAAGVIDGLRTLLDAVPGQVSGEDLVAREGSFGILVTVLAASIVDPAGRRRLSDTHRLLDLWGAPPLLHPLPSGVASVADWALHDLDSVRTWPLLHLNRELLAATSNMTLLASFTSPDYAVSEMESYIEFAHSLHGMYHGWQDGVRYYAERIADLLRDTEVTLEEADELDRLGEDALSPRRTGVIARLDDLVRDVERTELSLQSFVQSNEAIMLFVESPDIVASPPLRTDLDTILESNGYERLRNGFTRAVADVLGTRLRPLLDVVHRRMAQAYTEETTALREARDQRIALAFQLLGVVFGVVGLSGLAAILQAGNPGWGPDVAWGLLAGILVLAGLISLVLYLSARRGRRTLRRGGRNERR